MRIIVFIAVFAFVVAQGQTKPAEHKLNPQASRVWIDIENGKAELRRQYQEMEIRQSVLLVGAGVPEDSRQCTAASEIVVCVKPETAKK